MSQDAGDVSRRQAIVAFGRSVPDRWNGLLLRVSALSERFGGKTESGATIGESADLAGLTSSSARERWSAAAALGRNSQRTPGALAALVGSLSDPEEFVRWQAAQALAAQEAGEVFPILSELLDEPDPLRRSGAAMALGQLGGEAAALTLSRRLDDPDPVARAAIIEAMGEAGDPNMAMILLPFLEDPDSDVRRTAARSLGQLGNPGAGAALASALARPGQSLLVRRAAVAALVQVASPDVQPQLLSALSDADPQVRAYAARALGQVGSEQARAALGALKGDRTPLLRGTVGDAAREALALLEQRGRRGGEPRPDRMEDQL